MCNELTLNYAARPPWHQRRNFRRIVWVALLLLGAMLGWRFGPVAWQRAQLLYWQDKCRSYQTPVVVVFEEDPTAAAALLGSGKGYFPISRWTPDAGFVPDCFSRFSTAAGLALQPEPVLFLHQRVSPNGLTRIVAVQCDPGWRPEFTMTNYFDTWSIEPAGATRIPTSWKLLMAPRLKMGPMGNRKPGDPYIRFFAGQADPADASHFTIGYQLTSGGGTIDGWLRDSGVIDLKIRDGPPVVAAKVMAAYTAAQLELDKLEPLPPGVTGEQQRAATIAAYEKAIEINPRDSSAPKTLMEIACLLDSPAVAPEEPDKALAIYERLERGYPEYVIQATAGEAGAYFIKGDRERSLEKWRRVLELPIPANADPATVKDLTETKTFANKWLHPTRTQSSHGSR